MKYFIGNGFKFAAVHRFIGEHAAISQFIGENKNIYFVFSFVFILHSFIYHHMVGQELVGNKKNLLAIVIFFYLFVQYKKFITQRNS